MNTTTRKSNLKLAVVLILLAGVLAFVVGCAMGMNDNAEKTGAAHAETVARMEARSLANTCKHYPFLEVCSK